MTYPVHAKKEYIHEKKKLILFPVLLLVLSLLCAGASCGETADGGISLQVNSEENGTILQEDAVFCDNPDEIAPELRGHYTFQPLVLSIYLEEIFGRDMCEAWANLVEAVMAGEDTFVCKDQHTYDWVMGQFRDRCFPILNELIDYAWDRKNSVKNGIASFTYLVPPEEARAQIDAFGEMIEGILNTVLEDDYTDFEKALALYEHFSNTYIYDYDTYERMRREYTEEISCLRFFRTGKGICQEVSTAYSYLLMQAGVDATVMSGTRASDGEAHQWSYVRINGWNYHIDPTCVLDTHTLDYFMMNDEQREATGFGKDTWIITSNYAREHPHPDYAAEDDTFRPLWDGWYNWSFIHDEKILKCWGEDENGEYVVLEFDYQSGSTAGCALYFDIIRFMIAFLISGCSVIL